MDKELVENLYFEYYKLRELLDHYYLLTLNSVVESFKNKSKIWTDRFINSFDDYSEVKNFDTSNFKKLLRAEFNELKKQKEFNPAQREMIFKATDDFLTNYIKSLEIKIEEIPNSLDKVKCLLKGRIQANAPFDCDQLYEAVVLLKDELPPNIPDWIYDNWQKEYEKHKKERNKLDKHTERNIFWISRDFEDYSNYISRYKLFETYEFEEFYKVFNEIEKDIEQEILSRLTEQNAEISDFILDISRSKKLFNKYKPLINLSLDNIYKCQNKEGFWIRHFDEKTPDFDLSANSTLCLIKFAQNRKYLDAGIKGAKWLLANQNADGSWTSTLNKVSNEFITITALESIIRGKIATQRSIDRGTNWLLSQQSAFGGWDDVLLDVSIIDFIENITSLKTELTPYLKISKSYLNKSLELAQEDDMDCHRIAITTAFHGLEFFLYGLLSETNININIYKGKETIGFRFAKAKFQEYLQQIKKLKSSERLHHSGELDNLAYLRDEIVHKAAAVDMSTTLHLINKSIDFMSKYSKEILGYDIWY